MGPRSLFWLTSIREHAYKVTEELLLSDPYNEQVDKEVWVSWHYSYIVQLIFISTLSNMSRIAQAV
jgi:hypothetical protein